MERDSYILERDLQYEQMRKELKIQMEVYKDKVRELQTENYLVKADLELMTNKGEEQEDKLKEKIIINEGDKGKRMAPGLQTQKELERKKRSEVLKAFDCKASTTPHPYPSNPNPYPYAYAYPNLNVTLSLILTLTLTPTPTLTLTLTLTLISSFCDNSAKP